MIHGFVRTEEGEPVEGAVVTLLTKGGRQLDQVTSLVDGAYIVAVPGPGEYLLATAADGLGSRARPVQVAEGPLVCDVEVARVSEGEVDAVNQPSSAQP